MAFRGLRDALRRKTYINNAAGKTMVELPLQFLSRMKDMLGDGYEDFVASYRRDSFRALRINTLKDCEEVVKKEFELTRRVPWCENAYYYDETRRPGKNPLHEGGAFYIQEPSAMAVAENLDIREGDRILDLCAAPGGKSTQIAAKLKSSGILVANEIIPSRAKILSQNIERCGIRNCIVLNETPQALSGRFAGFFDKILVDAPCSGEGMFRKNPLAVEEWSPDNVRMCKERQSEILDCARNMLADGGTIVYSTCTFSKEENEDTVDAFLTKYRDFETVASRYAFEKGISSGTENAGYIETCNRIYPHKVDGEGHFFAVLRHRGERGEVRYAAQEKRVNSKACAEYEQWQNDNLNVRFAPNISFGDNLYATPEGAPRLDRLKVERAGLHLGVAVKNRFEPSHSLAIALKPCEVKRVVKLSEDDAYRYINGQTLEYEGEKGWALAVYKGVSLGWCKCDGSYAKNHYPKGLRK